MQLTQLRNFIAVVQSGSVRGAARLLEISQPSLTRSIRQLEEELQTSLLERTARGVKPTPAGQAFFARSRLIQHELQRAHQEIADLRGQEGGTVAFGVSPQAAIHIVPPAVSQFRLSHRHTDIRIVDGLSHRLLPQLREGALDFVIGPRPQGDVDASIERHALFTNRFVIAARRGHALRDARSLRDLQKAQWVVLSPSGFAASIIPDAFEKHRIAPPKSVIRSDSYVAMLALLARTDFVGALTFRLFQEDLVRNLFEPLQIKERLPEFTLCLFLRRGSPLTPAATAMVDAVRRAATHFTRP